MSWLKASRDPLPEPTSRTNRWLILVGAVSLAAIGIGLLVLMTQATGTRERYNQNYEWLVLINSVVASGLLITILWGTVRLLRSVYKGQFGSRLLVKLAGIFALVGVIPGLLIYVVSYQFVSRSIESWFDVKVEAALVAGQPIGAAGNASAAKSRPPLYRCAFASSFLYARKSARVAVIGGTGKCGLTGTGWRTGLLAVSRTGVLESTSTSVSRAAR